MKFSDQCKSEASLRDRVDVWLEAGRDGRCFSYSADPALELCPGDLVRVALRGRPMHGLVVRSQQSAGECGGDRGGSAGDDAGAAVPLQEVEELLQRAAVDSKWQQWIEQVAERCHLSPFRMLKAALPVGWLGQARPQAVRSGRSMSWITLCSPTSGALDPTPRQRLVLELLESHGSGLWQKDLEQQGFSAGLLRGLEQKGWILREKRRRCPGKWV